MAAMAFVGYATVITLVCSAIARGTLFRGERWSRRQERAACERVERMCRA